MNDLLDNTKSKIHNYTGSNLVNLSFAELKVIKHNSYWNKVNNINDLAIWNIAVITFVELGTLCAWSQSFWEQITCSMDMQFGRVLYCTAVDWYWFMKPLKCNFCFHDDFVRFYFSELILRSFYNFTQQCGHFIDFRFCVYK